MIKPDWSKAPEWAEWWAVDWLGFAIFYKNKPITGNKSWHAIGTEFEVDTCLKRCIDNWDEILVQRPQSSVTETTTATIELTPTELSILVTALGYATNNIDLDAVQPLQRKIIETYKEANNAR